MLDVQRIKKFNTELKEIKQTATKLESEVEFSSREIEKVCKELSEELGIEINSDNAEAVLAERMAKLENSLQAGESILERIKNEEMSMRQSEATQSVPVMQTQFMGQQVMGQPVMAQPVMGQPQMMNMGQPVMNQPVGNMASQSMGVPVEQNNQQGVAIPSGQPVQINPQTDMSNTIAQGFDVIPNLFGGNKGGNIQSF